MTAARRLAADRRHQLGDRRQSIELAIAAQLAQVAIELVAGDGTRRCAGSSERRAILGLHHRQEGRLHHLVGLVARWRRTDRVIEVLEQLAALT
jgi:hypothetical protein